MYVREGKKAGIIWDYSGRELFGNIVWWALFGTSKECTTTTSKGTVFWYFYHTVYAIMTTHQTHQYPTFSTTVEIAVVSVFIISRKNVNTPALQKLYTPHIFLYCINAEHCTFAKIFCHNTNYIHTHTQSVYKRTIHCNLEFTNVFLDWEYCFSNITSCIYKWIGNSHTRRHHATVVCTKKSDGSTSRLRTYKSLKSCSVAVCLYDTENGSVASSGLGWVGSGHAWDLQLLYCLGRAPWFAGEREREREKERERRHAHERERREGGKEGRKHAYEYHLLHEGLLFFTAG